MRRARLAPLLAGGVLAATTGIAHARRGGVAVEGCEGCHSGGQRPTVSIAADPMQPEPGASVLLTLRISRTNGNYGGFYLTTNRSGALVALTGQSARLVSPTEATHSVPRLATTGDVTFQMRWTAPATRGGVDFDLWGMSANGNNARTGDRDSYHRLSLTYGCPGVAAYVDRDGDGFGVDLEMTRVCELGAGYSAKGGDCNDNTRDVYPGAAELCDGYDNDCNGRVDDGLMVVTLYRDLDGDGHGGRAGEMRMGCVGARGFAPNNDDCNDGNKEIRPGAPELCNGVDDDCNGRVDDGARATCGVGWCRRQAPSCDPMSCVPGMPRPETCNLFDDDCDGTVDNGPNLCESGKVCFMGSCLTRDQAADAAAAAAAVAEPPPRRDGGVVPAPSEIDARAAGPSGEGEIDEDGDSRSGGGCALGGAPVPPAPPALVIAALAAAALRRRRRR